MKRQLVILLTVFLGVFAISCSKTYEETYPSLFRTDEAGNRVPRMFTWYDISSASGTLAIPIYYSGNWQIRFAEESTWAYLDRNSGTGVVPLHVGYLQNSTGATRTLILKLTCDNGELLDITIIQPSV
ncbi:MAG: BACON domain-containing protein [Bacteroidales bacterium]|nr:BACON domain-containing protein [Bacteroidales bacterium]